VRSSASKIRVRLMYVRYQLRKRIE
jgi:hypothetical protein